jgi:hypothetical protein
MAGNFVGELQESTQEDHGEYEVENIAKVCKNDVCFGNQLEVE